MTPRHAARFKRKAGSHTKTKLLHPGGTIRPVRFSGAW
jgi:hypothetical protein